MKVQTNNGITERESTTKQRGVVVSSNLKKESVIIDRNGNVIDPKTNTIINREEKE